MLLPPPLLLLLLLPQPSTARAAPAAPTPVITQFTQTLDHFSFSNNATFQQRVFTDDRHCPKASAAATTATTATPAAPCPVLVYFGNEGNLEDFWNNTGAMFELAPLARARVVFLEHRYYGESLPFGDQSYDDIDRLQYLTVEQALADMAGFLTAHGDDFGPVVIFGGSYGGMLAAWFMVKYPHLAAGALAASAPVDIYPGEHKADAFFEAGMYVYDKFGSPSCADWIRHALRRIAPNATAAGDNAVAEAPAWPLLRDRLRVCQKAGSVGDGSDVDRLLDRARLFMYVNGALSTMAMVDYPFAASFVTPMPANPVSYACKAAGAGLGRGSSDAELIDGLNTVINVFVNFTGQLSCHNISKELVGGGGGGRGWWSSHRQFHNHYHHHHHHPPKNNNDHNHDRKSLGDITRPWNYQACTELILEPLTSDGDGFYVPPPDLVPSVEAACQAQFPGVVSRPGWMQEAYGNGADIVRHTKNVIFSDGEKDPWRVGGVPADAAKIGDGSVIHMLIEGGAHHQDLRFADPRDPPGVTAAKARERVLILDWIRQYRSRGTRV